MTEQQASSSARPFATTRWSLVLAAGRRSSPEGCRALAVLCESYWYPLYAFVRRRGNEPAEAQDLTQAFFAQLLERDQLLAADPQRGRFRSFLLTSLQNFLNNEWRKARAEKRGGNRTVLGLDFAAGEARYHLEPIDVQTPEKLFERRWAMTLLENSVSRLQAEMEAAGRGPQFAALKGYLGGDAETVPYQVLAEQLGMRANAVKVAVHRLRRRCRTLLRAEIAETVATEADVDDELRALFAALSR